MATAFFPRDELFMRLAIREAGRALEHDDVPVGAVVVSGGEVIGAGHNERELRQDPTAHAELLALREAARHLSSWRILESVLYVTLEPCAMCAGAIVLGRVARDRRSRRAALQPPPGGRRRAAAGGVRGAARRLLLVAPVRWRGAPGSAILRT
jgi:hypothetical protein